MPKFNEKESFKIRLVLQYNLYYDELRKKNKDAAAYHANEIRRLEVRLSYM